MSLQYGVVTGSGGTALFANLRALCEPSGRMMTTFYVSPVSSCDTLGSDLRHQTLATGSVLTRVQASLNISFRPCGQGEYVEEGMCVECRYGSYSFVQDVTPETQCRGCMRQEGVEYCEKASLVASPGFWRGKEE